MNESIGPLNYHHLQLFWTVARLGSIARATTELNLSQPAISAQIRALETSLGEQLFTRTGRSLVLTDVGRLVFGYADEIFTTGRELRETLAGRPSGQPVRFAVGVADVVPKLLAYRLLEPALRMDTPVRLVLREDRPERLLADLAAHTLDLVLSDAPVPPSIPVRAHSHLLGECGVAIMGAPDLVKTHRRAFPRGLDGAPFLLPTESTTLRRTIDAWFTSQSVHPRVMAEIEDSAVLKEFGRNGLGLFVVPTAIEDEVRRQHGVRTAGHIEAIRERFYAITVERKVSNPAVLAVTQAARRDVFERRARRAASARQA